MSKKQVAPTRQTFIERTVLHYDALNGLTGEQIKQFMHEQSRKLDPLADPELATLEVEVDYYYDDAEVTLILSTSRTESDAELAARLEREQQQAILRKEAEKLVRRERRKQVQQNELALLAKLKAKYER